MGKFDGFSVEGNELQVAENHGAVYRRAMNLRFVTVGLVADIYGKIVGRHAKADPTVARELLERWAQKGQSPEPQTFARLLNGLTLVQSVYEISQKARAFHENNDIPARNAENAKIVGMASKIDEARSFVDEVAATYEIPLRVWHDRTRDDSDLPVFRPEPPMMGATFADAHRENVSKRRK